MEILIVVLVILLIAFAFKKPSKAIPNSLASVPCPPEYDPILGNLPELAKAGSLHEYLQLLHNQYGPLAGFRYFDKFVLSLASPDLFQQTSKLFNRPVALFSLFRPLIGDSSLQLANDEDAKNRRRLLDPFFAHSSVKNIFPVFIEATLKCIARWEEELKVLNSIHINLRHDMFNIAIYAISLSAFGSELKEEEMNVLQESYNHCWSEMEKTIKGSPIEEGTPRESIFFKHRDILFDLLERMVDRQHPTEGGEEEETINKGVGGFVEFMVQHKSFSHEQIKSDTMTFLIGGFHTTANFWMWTLYFLAKYPQYQTKVREEIKETLGDREPTFEDVCGMPFITAVLNETLRFVALAPFAGKYSNYDEIIGGIGVPKGTMMIQALGVVLQSEKFWGNSDTFSPERFLAHGATSEWSFKPFGVGNRMCPAAKYAMLEAKAVISTLIQKFEFALLAGQKDIKADYGIVGQMSEEVVLQVKPL